MNSAQMALRAVLIVAQRGGVTLSELADELQVARSTAHRILANCVSVGCVRQQHAGGRYVVGPALYEVALRMASAVALNDVITPILRDLHAELGYTTSHGVLEGRTVRFVLSLAGCDSQPLGSRMGQVRPAHSVAAGKAMLAFCSPRDLAERYPGRHLARVTERTVTDWNGFARQLDLVRTRGWANSVGESDLAVNEVSAPILTLNGDPVGSLGVAALSPRLSTRSEVLETVGLILDATSRIQWTLRNSPLPQLPLGTASDDA
ncbi:IclR family transcriptional regulator [Streptomyces lacrimifluminis]|uniref:IclR family transcriptional regulator n=1 Tax=Streptomyces lacrimifluminis TaxID=1500077 RepID=A0A917L463_9ACTN|nr:IclR family transcriptional regulator [Streptomyces lacrimifluminis]GGJ41245.1 IclR family transcriptional regulator [Streptomyces lacrimifluminis]